jgi:ribonuclease Z
VEHVIPTIGLRFDFGRSGRAMAYSCDTEPCPQVIRLAAGVDLLIHEASGESRGHSSAEQAGTVARKAEAGRLLLIHYPTGKYAQGDPVEEARRAFQGPVALAKDYMTIEMQA